MKPIELSAADQVRVGRVLWACADAALWRRFMRSLDPAVLELVRADEERAAREGLRQALEASRAEPGAAPRFSNDQMRLARFGGPNR